MTKAERTRQHIIEKAAPFFNKKGYADTSLMDVVAATGLTKGAIYGNFENKDQLALSVFEYNLGCMRRGAADAMSRAKDSRQKLKAMTSYFRNEFKALAAKGGCPLLNAATEADDNFPALKVKVKAAIRNWKTELITIIDSGKQAKQISKSIDSAKYATIFIALIEGGIMMSKATDDASQLNISLDMLDSIIDNEMKK